MVHHDAFTRQHDPEPPIAEPASFQRKLAKPRPQVAIIRSPMRVAHRRPIHGQDSTRPRLADRKELPNMFDCLALSGRLHQFFEVISFSTALSSIAPASNRFSRPFSSSNTFSLRACYTSMPP